jgi:hypothetical protein
VFSSPGPPCTTLVGWEDGTRDVGERKNSIDLRRGPRDRQAAGDRFRGGRCASRPPGEERARVRPGEA